MYDWLIRNSAILIVVGCFGPYLGTGSGLQAAHVLIYGFFLMTLPVYFLEKKKQASTFILHICVFWMLIVLWSAISTYANYYPQYDPNIRHIVSRGEKFLEPLVLMFVMSACMKRRLKSGGSSAMIMEICKVALFLAALNSAVAIVQLALPGGALKPMLSHFWQDSGKLERSSVASAAGALGRFTGIFNQPIEAGDMYSLVLMLWCYTLAKARRWPSVMQLAAVGLVVIGGLLSVSKVFLIGAPILAGIYMLSSGKAMRRSALILFLLAPVIFLSAQYVLIDTATGARLTKLSSYLDSSDVLSRYTAGRFTTGGTRGGIIDDFGEVWSRSPWLGTGIGSYAIVDNAYLEIFASGGCVALVLYLAMFGYALFRAIRSKFGGCEEGQLLLVVVLLLLGAGMGAPVLTLNRFSPIVWLVLTALGTGIGVRSGKQASGAPGAVAKR
ncbi:MAG: hypothetical protein HY923_02450 [Elusimicrobia bacterium]|nr:hypothetical protein [Elusimicrobiota bacterium]